MTASYSTSSVKVNIPSPSVRARCWRRNGSARACRCGQMNPEALQEGALTTAGNGALSIPKNPPHLNALKVYLDYLLSKEGQTEWSKAIGFASLRQDVPRDHVAHL